MKEFKCASNIGAGLFATEAVPIALNFPDGSRAVLKMHALTQDVLVELQSAGVKFEEYKDPADALKHSKEIIDRIVESGEWFPVEGDAVTIDESNKHRMLSNMGLTAATISAARALAEELVEVEEKNSVSSSAGSLIPRDENTGLM